MRPQVILNINSGELKGKKIVFEEPTSYTIGRAKNCNLCFSDNDSNSGISRYHCLLEIDPPRVYIRDLGSTNGTLINGQFLDATELDIDLSSSPTAEGTNYQLKSGDEINIGDIILNVEIELPQEESALKIPTQSTAAKTPSLKSLAIKGVSWTIIGYGANQILRFAFNIILTRLLEPKIFGLMSLINIFVLSLQFFSDVGINQSVIRHQRGEDPVFLNTAWTVQVIRGIVIWVMYLVISWPISRAYEQPELLWLIPFAGLNAVIMGFNSTILAVFNRQMSTKSLSTINIATYLVQMAISLLLTLISRTVWPLIIGSLVSSLFKLGISHWLNRKSPNRFAWDKDALKELFSFGRWIFISTMIAFLANQADVVILGKLAPLAKLGVYNIAFTISDIPRQVIAALSTNVVFPIISKKIHLPREAFKNTFSSKRNLLLLPAAIFIAIMASFGDLIISVIYDDRYRDARWMITILSLGLWQTLLYRTMGSCLIALGKPFYAAQGNFLRFVVILIGLPLVYSFKGLVGAVILMSFSDLPVYICISYGLWREKLCFLVEDLKLSLLFISCVIILSMGRMYLGLGNPLIHFGL